MNEMSELERLRAEIPRPAAADLRAEEGRLMAAIGAADASAPGTSRARPRPRARRRTLGFGLGAGLAAGALVAGAVVVTGDPSPHGGSGTTTPHLMPVASVQLLNRAADSVRGQKELHPKPGQFLVYESQSTNLSEDNDAGRHWAYLTREKRKVWLPLDGDSTRGFIEAERLAPKAIPGEAIPPHALKEVGRRGPEKLADTDGTGGRTGYQAVSRLPTDPAKMYEHLYTGLGHDARADWDAWGRVGELLGEVYLPAAQRAALFKAASAIHGVTTTGKAADAAGRKGVAASMVDPIGAEREEYVFDPKTYDFLGTRSVVINAGKAKMPVGTVTGATAQLRVSLADQAPPV
ncbi:CU044_5270 family protein [Actinomadura xylanilytica]|uniref:CU044_5270 family protein n=1 Tax=Actinomadura xylanilytica TaxID=887459 RepID=UPI00255A961B|nr:CU044_5270 family protein [Actinomadura xylanilytica]MDL4772547.1 CU044_5270 family protein [Actinomadura xylanilytica]